MAQSSPIPPPSESGVYRGISQRSFRAQLWLPPVLPLLPALVLALTRWQAGYPDWVQYSAVAVGCALPLSLLAGLAWSWQVWRNERGHASMVVWNPHGLTVYLPTGEPEWHKWDDLAAAEALPAGKRAGLRVHFAAGRPCELRARGSGYDLLAGVLTDRVPVGAGQAGPR